MCKARAKRGRRALTRVVLSEVRNKIAGGFGGAISPPNGVRGGAPENFGFVSSKWPILGPPDDFSTM